MNLLRAAIVMALIISPALAAEPDTLDAAARVPRYRCSRGSSVRCAI